MKKLVIILTIAIMLFVTKEQRTEQSSKVTEEIPLNAGMEQTEETKEVACASVPTEATKEETVVQEIPMKECAEKHRDLKATEPEKAVKCVDQGNQNLAEYKSQPSGQVNPFENAPPAEIVDHPVEDLIGEGEDRPGEGKHF